jgi:hypothetical protein
MVRAAVIRPSRGPAWTDRTAGSRELTHPFLGCPGTAGGPVGVFWTTYTLGKRRCYSGDELMIEQLSRRGSNRVIGSPVVGRESTDRWGVRRRAGMVLTFLPILGDLFHRAGASGRLRLHGAHRVT